MNSERIRKELLVNISFVEQVHAVLCTILAERCLDAGLPVVLHDLVNCLELQISYDLPRDGSFQKPAELLIEEYATTETALRL